MIGAGSLGFESSDIKFVSPHSIYVYEFLISEKINRTLNLPLGLRVNISS